MNILNRLLSPGINFVKSNLEIIVLVLCCLAIFLIGYIVTALSLKKLKSEVFSYYPFDKFFPKSGHWSIIYFLITIILLAAIIYFISRGGFYLGPA